MNRLLRISIGLSIVLLTGQFSQAQDINICMGGSAFLDAEQTFPTGPFGPNGANCTPILGNISISPTTEAFPSNNEGFYVYPTQTTTYTVTSVGTNAQGTCNNVIQQTFTVVVDEQCIGNNFFVFDSDLFLEGAYNPTTGLMNTNLNELLPLSQPFGGDPYFFEEDESIPAMPTNIVDWVLVEMRLGTPSLSNANTIVLERRACLIREDGKLVDIDGFQGIVFSKLVNDQEYHVVIRHRNHLDVMNNFPITAIGNGLYYDFTAAQNQAFGPEQLKPLGNNVYGLYSGDYTGDGVIQSTDYDVWTLDPAVNNAYEVTDGNLDGVVQATDFDAWFANKAKVGAAEVQLD